MKDERIICAQRNADVFKKTWMQDSTMENAAPLRTSGIEKTDPDLQPSVVSEKHNGEVVFVCDAELHRFGNCVD